MMTVSTVPVYMNSASSAGRAAKGLTRAILTTALRHRATFLQTLIAHRI